MGLVRVEDVVLWINHIEGDEVLRERLLRLPEDAVVRLEVGGRAGLWQKMKNATVSHRPTNGLKPQGEITRFWRDLYERYKAEGGIVVGIADPSDAAPRTTVPSARPAPPPIALEQPDPERREMAIADLQNLRTIGWSSGGVAYGTRDEWYAEDGV